MTEKDNPEVAGHFIEKIIDADLASGKHQQIVTRFPPEPNGFLHIGHAKSICLNFGLAQQYQGQCHLRFDDTNPEKEESLYAKAIEEDVRWLGFEWSGEICHASDYFLKLYEYAVMLIEAGKAYVCELSPDEMNAYRGTLTEPGKPSPWRDRPASESLAMFEKMREGALPEGACVLRAKIDMASGNVNMRDPVMYRVRHVQHHRTGDAWCIYPMYDFTHCVSDALEGITHSLCTLEFQDHRPLYDWYLDQLPVPCHPQQIEFSRLNVSHTVTSKRKLRQLVEEGAVSGWDDPRMPTISGMRRRGYPAAALRAFCVEAGISKSDSVIDMGVLEAAVRRELNESADRAMGVLRPLKLTLTNYPEAQLEKLSAPRHPQDESRGQRELLFSRTLYIEQDDFRESANKHFKRLVLGKEVRLRNAYVIRCDEVVKNEQGEIVELLCSYDPDTLGKNPEGRKVKGVIHWVAESSAVRASVRCYDRLFQLPDPGRAEDLMAALNPHSLALLEGCLLEANLAHAAPGAVFQFERQGYFVLDKESTSEQLVFNQVVGLRDSWAEQAA